jgi:hypothetical protein
MLQPVPPEEKSPLMITGFEKAVFEKENIANKKTDIKIKVKIPALFLNSILSPLGFINKNRLFPAGFAIN